MGSAVGFLVESLFFRIRDRISPPLLRLNEAGVIPGKTLLDFGCGTGGCTVAAAGLVGEEGRVFGLDADPHAVAAAKKRVSRARLDNVTVLLSDRGTVPLEDNSVDVVLLYDVLHDLGHPEQVLSELRRVLKPDGLLSVSDHHLREADILSIVTAGRRFRVAGKGLYTYSFSPSGESN